jgi:hypothetical protein
MLRHQFSPANKNIRRFLAKTSDGTPIQSPTQLRQVRAPPCMQLTTTFGKADRLAHDSRRQDNITCRCNSDYVAYRRRHDRQSEATWEGSYLWRPTSFYLTTAHATRASCGIPPEGGRILPQSCQLVADRSTGSRSIFSGGDVTVTSDDITNVTYHQKFGCSSFDRIILLRGWADDEWRQNLQHIRRDDLRSAEEYRPGLFTRTNGTGRRRKNSGINIDSSMSQAASTRLRQMSCRYH